MKLRLAWTVAISALPLGQSLATESVTYTYDALGRVVTTAVSGGPNTGLNTALNYDAASNRTALTVTGSKNPGARPVAVVMLPLAASAPAPFVIPILNPDNR